MCYSVLQCVAVCCSVLQCVAVCCGVLHICELQLTLDVFHVRFFCVGVEGGIVCCSETLRKVSDSTPVEYPATHCNTF